MHEISIAESILEIAEATAREANARSIRVIGLRLGAFTTIARDALEFAFVVARQGTLAQEARLEIEVVAMIVQCVVCDLEVPTAPGKSLVCQQCGFPLKIISGQELMIDYIEVDDGENEAEGSQPVAAD